MNIKNGDVINLALYRGDDLTSRVITISKDINNITLTSNKKLCDFVVFIEKRNTDLTINIKDLNLYSKKGIVMNFASGDDYNYKSYLKFLGTNIIKSKNDIAICVTNNQTLEINGDANSFLKISGGSGVPTIGSSFYTEGAGNLIFSGEGFVEIIAGDDENRGSKEKILGSGCGIGFFSESVSDISTIKVLDNINLKVVGEDGGNILTMSQDKIADKGGSAIYVKGNGFFEKTGSGILELSGGQGGECVGDYGCGICGDGGCAITFENGVINIGDNSILRSGNGGSITDEYEFSVAKGGNGGDAISILQDKGEDESTIKIASGTKVYLGSGGESGSFIDARELAQFQGGKNGNFINCNEALVKAEISDIDVSGVTDIEEIKKMCVGRNIEVKPESVKEIEENLEVENVEDKEELLKDIEKLQSEGYEKIEDEIEEDEILDSNEDELENLKNNIKNILNSDLNGMVSENKDVEENIIDDEVEKENLDISEDNEANKETDNLIENSTLKEDIYNNESEGLQDDKFNDNNILGDKEQTEDSNIDKDNKLQKVDEPIKKSIWKSIWEAIKRFFIGED